MHSFSTKPIRAQADALVLRHEQALMAFAIRLCGTRADACDLVQDTFERALRGLDRVPDGDGERAWLLTLLHHRFIDQCRRRRRVCALEPLELAAPVEPEPPRWANVSREQLVEAVGQLSPSLRVVFELHGFERLSYKEISQRLGLPGATVGTRLLRARRLLRELLRVAAAQGTASQTPLSSAS